MFNYSFVIPSLSVRNNFFTSWLKVFLGENNHLQILIKTIFKILTKHNAYQNLIILIYVWLWSTNHSTASYLWTELFSIYLIFLSAILASFIICIMYHDISIYRSNLLPDFVLLLGKTPRLVVFNMFPIKSAIRKIRYFDDFKNIKCFIIIYGKKSLVCLLVEEKKKKL